MSSRADHVTTETVYGQTLALWLRDGDEHRALELDTTGLNVKSFYWPFAIKSIPSYGNHFQGFQGSKYSEVVYHSLVGYPGTEQLSESHTSWSF